MLTHQPILPPPPPAIQLMREVEVMIQNNANIGKPKVFYCIFRINCNFSLGNKCLNKCPFDITQPTQTGKPDVGLQLQRLGFPGSRKISSAKTAG